MIARRQERIHHALGQLDFAPAEGVKHIFRAMAKPNHWLKVEKPRRAFYGVKRAKDPVQQLSVVWGCLQRDHVLVHALQEFLRFHEELLNHGRIL